MAPLSLYILTYNSEKYLEQILASASRVCDEIIIVDSGSTDSTKVVGQKFNCKIYDRAFDNFREQRNFALSQCTHDYVLSFDSD